MTVSTFTPYSTVRPLMGTSLPSWISAADAERLEAYRIYEQMYWNVPDTFKLVQRGSESTPVYVPSPKIIVEAKNRFLAKGWDFLVSPKFGTPEDQLLVQRAITRLFKREMMWTKFATQRRYGLIRGDACWHVVADEAKPEGRRISIHELDPGSYFPIYATDDLDRIVGCHIADQIPDPKDPSKIVVRRQTYRKTETGTISSECTLWELGKWDDRTVAPGDLKQVGVLVPLFELPPIITTLPVYHIKNVRTPGDPYGSSELRGIERLAAAVNQAITDEELSLAFDGIGVYATTSGPPVDEEGNELNWRLGPGRVAELGGEDDKFWRVNGVGSVAPFLDHIRFIMGTMQQAAAVPDIAAGNVDVSVAESGIALYLQLAPILADCAEKESEMLGIYDHMLYDLTQMWLPAFEQMPAGIAVDVTSRVDDPMPVNREARVAELLQLLTSNVITAEYARQELTKYGYDFPTEMGEAVVAEQAALSTALAGDPFASRVDNEITAAEEV